MAVCKGIRLGLFDSNSLSERLNLSRYGVAWFGFKEDVLQGVDASGELGSYYSGLNLNQDKAMKPQAVQIVRQGEVTPYWFKVNPLYLYCWWLRSLVLL